MNSENTTAFQIAKISADTGKNSQNLITAKIITSFL